MTGFPFLLSADCQNPNTTHNNGLNIPQPIFSIVLSGNEDAEEKITVLTC